jgi:hypothetical protein
MKALSVVREDRIPTVEKFAEGMRSQKSHAKTILLVALFLVIITAGIGYKPYLSFRAEQALYDKVEAIKRGDKALMIETIWSLEQLIPEHQKILSVGLRREIITFYRDRIRSVFRPKEGLYDYPEALELIAQAEKHYPDSVALSTIKDQLKEQKDRLMGSLISLYNRYYKNKKLIKSPSGEDLTTVIPLIRRVDPEHELLKDKKLANLYLSQAESLISKRKYNEASKYILTGLQLYPEDSRLLNLSKQISAKSTN